MKFISVLFILGFIAPPSVVYSSGNVFSKSPLELARERSDARTRQILEDTQRQIYYRGAILDYDLLSGYTQVPPNILKAAAAMSSKEGREKNNFVIDFAETVGQYLAEGRGVRSAVHAVFPDDPRIADELLEYAISIAKPHTTDDTIRLNADSNGHFWATANIDGTEVAMLVDTGASSVLLRQEDAIAIGIDPSKVAYDVPVNTAAGKKFFGTATVENLEIFGASFHTVRVLISPLRDPNGSSLLGMSILRNFSNISFSGSQLVIKP
ncbi:retropepsin-like aspartic protease family protein [Roseovarius nanhaiticus]|uniref:retropepsin-like aspartic protease family protein n=1 Tax=Roseovarius nanhaiticus TaxID=573024 RepID=UPI002491D278|nr:TIGR02281 family clan AA aspartic protease [Roseovarius nanhaiticus]